MPITRTADFNQAVQAGLKNLDSGESWTNVLQYDATDFSVATSALDTNTTTTGRSRLTVPQAVGTPTGAISYNNSGNPAAGGTYAITSSTYSALASGLLICVTSHAAGALTPTPTTLTPVRANVTFTLLTSYVAAGPVDYQITVFAWYCSTLSTGTTVVTTSIAATSMCATVWSIQGLDCNVGDLTTIFQNVTTSSATKAASTAHTHSQTVAARSGSTIVAVGVNDWTTPVIPTVPTPTGGASSTTTTTIGTPDTRVGTSFTRPPVDASARFGATETITLPGTWTASTFVALVSFELCGPNVKAVGGGSAGVAALAVAGTQTEKDVDIVATGLQVTATTSNNGSEFVGFIARRNGTSFLAFTMGRSNSKTLRYMSIYYVVAGVWTLIGQTSATAAYQTAMRAQVFDDPAAGTLRVRLRGWTGSEPSTWDVDTTSSAAYTALSAAGTSGLISYRSGQGQLGNVGVLDFVVDNFIAQGLITGRGRGAARAATGASRALSAPSAAHGSVQSTAVAARALSTTAAAKTLAASGSSAGAVRPLASAAAKGSAQSTSDAAKALSVDAAAVGAAASESAVSRALGVSAVAQGWAKASSVAGRVSGVAAAARGWISTAAAASTVRSATAAACGWATTATGSVVKVRAVAAVARWWAKLLSTVTKSAPVGPPPPPPLRPWMVSFAETIVPVEVTDRIFLDYHDPVSGDDVF